jgi:hypothetical protein
MRRRWSVAQVAAVRGEARRCSGRYGVTRIRIRKAAAQVAAARTRSLGDADPHLSGPPLAAVMPALIATEVAVWVVATRGGWGKMKLLATFDLVRALPRLLTERRTIQSAGCIRPAEFASGLASRLDSPYFGPLGAIRWWSVRLELGCSASDLERVRKRRRSAFVTSGIRNPRTGTARAKPASRCYEWRRSPSNSPSKLPT